MAEKWEVVTGLYSPNTMKGWLGGDKQPASNAAANQYADMTRSLWYQWMNEIGRPQEDKLIEYATDPTVVTDAMQTASADAMAGFDRGQENTQRRLEGLGLTLTAEEQGAADRSSNLARSLADVGAQNRARDQTLARQQAIIGNPVPTIGALR